MWGCWCTPGPSATSSAACFRTTPATRSTSTCSSTASGSTGCSRTSPTPRWWRACCSTWSATAMPPAASPASATVRGGTSPTATEERGNPGAARFPHDAALGDDAGDELGRRDVERRVAHRHALRRPAPVAVAGHLDRRPLLDRDARAVRDLRIEGRERGGDVKRDAVALRQNGEGIGADLVRHVAVGRDAI